MCEVMCTVRLSVGAQWHGSDRSLDNTWGVIIKLRGSEREDEAWRPYVGVCTADGPHHWRAIVYIEIAELSHVSVCTSALTR